MEVRFAINHLAEDADSVVRRTLVDSWLQNEYGDREEKFLSTKAP